MKLLGGGWSKGDVIALAGLLVAVVTTVLTVPELRRLFHIDGQIPSRPPIESVHFKKAFTFKQAAFNITPSPTLHFGFSTLERDESLAGKTVTVTNIKVVLGTANHSSATCCDVWTFLGPVPFNFPEGSTSVAQVGSYPWDITSTLAPTQVKLVIGHAGPDTGTDKDYSIRYDFETNAAIVDPIMSFVVKSSMHPQMKLVGGLYAQVLVWTGLNDADIDVQKITLDVEGKMVQSAPSGEATF